MSTTMPQYLEIFSTLTEEDRKAILDVGVAFRRVEIEKKLARAQSIIQNFEKQFGMTFERLEEEGLPEDADYRMHEDYISWSHYTRVAKKAQETLRALDALSENRAG